MKPERAKASRAMLPVAALLLAGTLFSACGKREPASPALGLSGRDSAILRSPARATFSSQAVVRLSRRRLADTLEVPIRIEADERLSSLVVAPAAGRLEEVYIRTPEQWIRAGERIALLYSPELVTAQRELLLLSDGDSALSAAAVERLRRMGMTSGQIRAMRSSGTPLVRIPLSSPRAGFALLQPFRGMPGTMPEDAASGMGGAMGGAPMDGGMGGGEGSAPKEAAAMSGPGQESGAQALRAGVTVSRGTILARINDLSRVAAILTLPSRSASAFKVGDSLLLAMPAIGFAGRARLDFLESRVVDTSGNVQGIAYLPNPGGRLALGALGQARVSTRPDSAWALPRSAVHALGERHIVWARSRSDTALFEAREVRIGRSGSAWTEVLEGLEPEAEVAQNAALLLDPDVVLEPLPLGGERTPMEDGHGAHGGSGHDHAAHGPAPEEAPDHGASHAHPADGSPAETLVLSEAKARLAGVRTARVDSLLLAPSQVFRAVVRLDERSQAVVAARIEGRVEQDAVPRVGERVRSGQVLAYLVGEPFLAAQEEYLVARRSAAASGNPEVVRSQVQAARRRLEVMGMPSALVARLERSGKVVPRLPVPAPRDGLLLAVDAQPGQYVQPGQAMFTVGMSDRVWVETWLLANEVATYPPGTEASIRVEGIEGGPRSGRLEHIRSGTTLSGSVTLAHIGLPNPEGRLLPGMQASVTLRQAGREALVIPPAALLPASQGTMVWIETDRFTYSPRMVRTGLGTAEGVEILEGLHSGERVVIAGAYLLGSELTLRKGAGRVHAGH